MSNSGRCDPCWEIKTDPLSLCPVKTVGAGRKVREDKASPSASFPKRIVVSMFPNFVAMIRVIRSFNSRDLEPRNVLI